ncbi:MAG: TIGR00282 family metallophosphoesterase [Alphaproteobacteria bacterium]|nr:TIGR00282 family metallophosphoesterase [Alphaproteobacteria bacterium]
MKIMFFGDIVGRSGRDGLAKHLPDLKKRFAPDVIIANAENIASGHGITMKLAQEIFELGVACITSGNHIWGQRELLTSIGNEPRILRPQNYPEGTPGKGAYTHNLADGRKLLIVNLMARVFMEPVLDDPFAAMEKIVSVNKIGGNTPILVDFHGETTSEKGAFAHAFDGRVSAVLGTHTHAPAADERILPRGTAYMSDVGMCGDYDSVIGMKKETAIWRFTRKTPIDRLAPAEGEATVCGALVTLDDKTGLAVSIAAIRIGGLLKPT